MHHRGDGSFTVDGGTLDLRNAWLNGGISLGAPQHAKNTSPELHTD